MAQLLIRNLNSEIKERLRQRAALNGTSMEAEARLILRMALSKPPIQQAEEEGLGTKIARMFEGVGMDFELPEDEFEVPFEFPDE